MNPAVMKLLAVALGLALAAAGGWTTRGWKEDARHADLQRTIAQGVAAAATEARAIEHRRQETVNAAIHDQHVALENINRDLQRELDSLRRRASRASRAARPEPVPAAESPARPCATGAELCREDAEFLRREAARADTVRAGLVGCYAVSDAP